MDDTPHHLRIETYYISKVQELKDHTLGMVELALPEDQRTVRQEDWEQLLYSPRGQFQVLFASLDCVKPKIGEEVHQRLVRMAKEAEQLFNAGDARAFAFKVQDMGDMAWMPKRGVKERGVA